MQDILLQPMQQQYQIKFINMKLKTKNKLVNIVLSDSLNKLDITPRLYLDLPRITISSSYKRYEDVHMKKDILGSLKFLDVDNEIDVMVFNSFNLELIYLELGIPFNIKLTQNYDTNSRINSSETKKTISIIKEESFNLIKSEYAFYNKEEDILTLSYEANQENNLVGSIEVTKDFFILYQGKNIIGWKLKKCCQYLCNYKGESEPLMGNNSQLRILLAEFFSLFKKETFIQMEKQNEQLKKKLVTIFNLSKENKAYAICEVIEEWIEDYW